eukprot:s2300_g6.t1
MAESLAIAASEATGAAEATAATAVTVVPSAASSQRSLDLEFATTMQAVEVALASAPRTMRIRGEQWAQRLQLMASVTQPLFQKDRNLHADLLLKCIQAQAWTEPLDKHPPEGPLPCLPRHVACSLRKARAERLRASRSQGCAEVQRPSDSLAMAAAAAVSGKPEARTSMPEVSVAAPPAYAALAARVAHLELQNKQLRRQLLEARNRPGPEARPRTPRPAPRPTPRPASPAPSAHSARGAFAAPPRSEAMVAPVAAAHATAAAHSTTAAAHVADPPARVRAEVQGPVSAPGPPPPEGDTEAFLRYLDAFQSYAGSLFAPKLDS